MARLRILITGAGGFVGGHLVDALRQQLIDAEIRPTTIRPHAMPDGGYLQQLDVTDAAAVTRAIADFHPTHLVHLAGLSTLAAAEADRHATGKSICSARSISRMQFLHVRPIAFSCLSVQARSMVRPPNQAFHSVRHQFWRP